MFAADCPMKRAALMTDMTLGRWSHVPAIPRITSCKTTVNSQSFLVLHERDSIPIGSLH